MKRLFILVLALFIVSITPVHALAAEEGFAMLLPGMSKASTTFTLKGDAALIVNVLRNTGVDVKVVDPSGKADEFFLANESSYSKIFRYNKKTKGVYTIVLACKVTDPHGKIKDCEANASMFHVSDID